MIGICPECSGTVKGRKCTACGWTQIPEAAKTKNEYQHSPLRRCIWHTDGKQCFYLANLSTSEWCAWHREWAKVSDKAHKDERAVLNEWLEQFHDHRYGHNCGGFGDDPSAVWLAVTGAMPRYSSQGQTRQGAR